MISDKPYIDDIEKFQKLLKKDHAAQLKKYSDQSHKEGYAHVIKQSMIIATVITGLNVLDRIFNDAITKDLISNDDTGRVGKKTILEKHILRHMPFLDKYKLFKKLVGNRVTIPRPINKFISDLPALRNALAHSNDPMERVYGQSTYKGRSIFDYEVLEQFTIDYTMARVWLLRSIYGVEEKDSLADGLAKVEAYFWDGDTVSGLI